MTTTYPPRTKTYADYPACLTTYKWLVEDALKSQDKTRMFHMVERHGYYPCKVCGVDVLRSDFEAHVLKHAVEVKLVSADSVAPEVTYELYEDIRVTIADTLAEKCDGIVFDDVHPDITLTGTVLNDVSEGSAGIPALCPDCRI